MRPGDEVLLPDGVAAIPCDAAGYSLAELADRSVAVVGSRSATTYGVGVAGELCIGGDGLARDYLRSPELTAQKFFADPFTAGSRLYATGEHSPAPLLFLNP